MKVLLMEIVVTACLHEAVVIAEDSSSGTIFIVSSDGMIDSDTVRDGLIVLYNSNGLIFGRQCSGRITEDSSDGMISE